MKACWITFRSVTPAQRGEKILKAAGVSCVLRRTPGFMQEQGCGYSLSLEFREANRAVELLRQGQIPFRKLYLRRESGAFEELGEPGGSTAP